MEYIGGWPINDVKDLKENGYDLDEIGKKFVNSFIKQVMEDGFFHADPHPGNVKILDGKIVWIDMGMMGRLNDHDRRIMIRGVRGIALHDVTMVENAVLEIGEFKGTPDRARLYQDLKGFLEQFGSASFGAISIADEMQALMEIMKKNRIRMPHGMTMLCRGLANMEGVLTTISPDINMMEIASNRITDEYLENLDWKNELSKNARALYRASAKGIEIPSLTVDALKEYIQGQGLMNINLRSTENFTEVLASSVRNFVIGICVAALLISSSILCTTDMEPKILGIPVLGFIGFAAALSVSVLLIVRYIIRKVRSSS